MSKTAATVALSGLIASNAFAETRGGFSLRERLLLPGHGSPVRALAFSPDGTTLASACRDGSIVLWNPRTGKAKVVITGHDGSANSVAFSPDGLTLASGGDDRTLRLWDVPSGQER